MTQDSQTLTAEQKMAWDDDLSHVPFNDRVKVWAELMLGSEEGAQRKIEEARNGLR